MVNSAGFGFNLPALLRRLEPGGFEMLVVAEVFPATFREHHLKGHTIGEAKPAFPGWVFSPFEQRRLCDRQVFRLILQFQGFPNPSNSQRSGRKISVSESGRLHYLLG